MQDSKNSFSTPESQRNLGVSWFLWKRSLGPVAGFDLRECNLTPGLRRTPSPARPRNERYVIARLGRVFAAEYDLQLYFGLRVL